MTMAQGELFNGDEGTSELFTTDLHGQSQTKEAKYARAYRSDPKNKDRINSQKKRRRALKKESELGSVSSMFSESVAAPAKNEPQTVEKVLNKSNKPSLANCGTEASRFIQAEILSQLAEMRKALENLSRDNSQKIIELQKQIVMGSAETKEFSKSATPALPNINGTEQQTQISEVANVEKNISNNTIENQDGGFRGRLTANVPVEQQVMPNSSTSSASKLSKGRKPFSMILSSAVVMLFLCFNTYFLVFEQKSLYESMSYSAGMALMIAVLSEASLILLSVMASLTSKFEWKLLLTTTMLAMVAVMVGVLDSSAKNRSNTAVRQTQEAKNIEKQLRTLRALEAPILAQIKSLDPEVYPTKISRLSSKLTNRPEGYSYKIEKLSKRLASISTAGSDTSKLIWQRRVALLINLIFSAFLGSLWSCKSESLTTKISRSIKSYFSNPCET